MPVDINTLEIFRMVPTENLEVVLRKGLFSKNHQQADNNLLTIGNKEIIERRYRAKVKCYPQTVVNDYVAFYFSVRTPMLMNINTGYNVPYYPQKDIVYLCFKAISFTSGGFQWCYTDGNASLEVAKFYNDFNDIDNRVNWSVISSTNFTGKDRTRQKHAEFLVKDYVSSDFITRIVIINDTKKKEVEDILSSIPINIPVEINTQYYF